jgi:glucose/arabinose dehydrogenase
LASAPLLVAQGIQQDVVATQIDSPVAMAVAPDGRVFVTEQGGAVRVIRDDVLLPQPFVVVPTVADDEEGLTGIAFDPAFATNGRVYLRVTVATPTRHNRVVRYTANGDVALPGSVTVFDLEQNQAHFHLGTGLHFGPDGKLYLATGDNDTPFFAGILGSLHGKMLRINADGSVPTDNPWYGSLSGNLRAIWAMGLRNTFAFAIEPGTGLVFGNDVGTSQWEEINQITASGNYGWPANEGPSGPNTHPVYAYSHSGPTGGCAVTGGCFYVTATPQLPAQYLGKYLFTEFCRGEIRAIDPLAPASATVLATSIVSGPVDLAVAADGALYVLARGSTSGSGGTGIRTGALVKISAAGSVVPTFTTYGDGCAGSLGVPYLRPSAAPRLGDVSFMLFVGNALPFTAGGLQLGSSNTSWQYGPLPLDLSPLGLTGCFMRTSSDQLLTAFNGAGNELPLSVGIPNVPTLLGATVYLQALVLDPAANQFGGAITAGVAAHVGN